MVGNRPIVFILLALLVISFGIAYYSIKKHKPKVAIVSVLLLLTGINIIQQHKQDEFQDEQIKIIKHELGERYFLSSAMSIALLDESSEGNTYQVDTLNGLYEVHFNDASLSGFKLRERQGEHLRGRRNVFDTIQQVGADASTSDILVEYNTPDLYTVKVDEEEWVVTLVEDVVERIVDTAGNLKYTYVAQETRDSIKE